MILGTVVIQPGDKEDYDIEFEEYLADPTDVLSSFSVLSTLPAGELTVTAAVASATRGKIWVEAPQDAVEGLYMIECLGISIAGRKKEIELEICVEES